MSKRREKINSNIIFNDDVLSNLMWEMFPNRNLKAAEIY